MASVAEDGKSRQMLCISIDQVARWLLGINPNKVKPEIKEQLVLFQDKLQNVLYEVVFGKYASADLSNQICELKRLLLEMQRTQDRLVAKVFEQDTVIQKQNQTIERLERNSGVFGRFVKSEAKTSASRLAHQRWAKKEYLQ